MPMPDCVVLVVIIWMLWSML